MNAGTSRIAVLRKRAEFLAVAEKGRKWVTPVLILQKGAPRETESAQVRYGLTASGKIGNAVTRNRARRRLRALAQAVLPRHAAPGCDYVLIARVTTPTCAFAALEENLRTALRKLGRGVTETLNDFFGFLLRGLIWLYRHSLSMLMGRQCRFLPTCSAYADEAIRLHGAAKGSALAFRRFCRCHPWGGSGFDPVPLPDKKA